jgi:hypothetical protein
MHALGMSLTFPPLKINLVLEVRNLERVFVGINKD